ncbi:MAG: phosphoribosylanthranilate isomerase [Pseudomonadota bacterium]
MPVAIKFCGLSKPADIDAAVSAGAAYVGFVFFAKSPRAVTLAQARDLARLVPPGIARVGLCVDMNDAGLEEIAASGAVDTLQLHGAESPGRVTEVKARFGLPVIKAVGLSQRTDLERVRAFARVADQVLIDAKPPEGADLPGGNGVAFDWGLVQGLDLPVPWLLAGGLTPDNVAQAVQATGARQVDVSSGVETAPGQKDPALIAAFAEALSFVPSPG